MRRMPKTIYDDVQGAIEIPTTPKWDEMVLAFIGRPVTSDESRQIEKMKDHNWTVRVVSEAILGRDLTFEEVEERRKPFDK